VGLVEGLCGSGFEQLFGLWHFGAFYPAGGVMVSSLNQAYYSRNFYAAGRVEGTEVPQAEELLEAATAQALN
jgi:hypothetical protein